MSKRTTCLYCEQDGVTTPLVSTPRGKCCPIHQREFIAALERQARAFLGLPDPTSLRNRKGLPATRPM